MVDFQQFIPGIGSVGSIAKMSVYGLLIGTCLAGGIKFVRDFVKYKYSAEVFKRRQESFEDNLPQAQIISGKAGYFTRKSTGRNVFRIKYGKMPWERIELTKLPDPKYMIGNKVYYMQLQKDNFVQAKVSIDWDSGLKLEPVEDDLKYGAMQDILEKDGVLEQKRLTPLVAGIIVTGVILVAGIIVFYFLSKA